MGIRFRNLPDMIGGWSGCIGPLLSAALLWAANPLSAQESAATFDEKSAALRTALHYDPSLTAPLEDLVGLYGEAERLSDLTGIYRTHLSQYPADAGAHAVLYRVLKLAGDQTASALIRESAERFPDHAWIQYLHAQQLITEGENPLMAMIRAIQLDDRPSRRLDWAEELVDLSLADEEKSEVTQMLKNLAVEMPEVAALTRIAPLLGELGDAEAALKLAEQASNLNGDPETRVELEMLSARMEALSGDTNAAATRLGLLLEGMTPDYWRRSEITGLRLALLENSDSRVALVDALREKLEAQPANEGLVLDLADTLEGMGAIEEAEAVLLEAAERIPHAATLEKRLLASLDDESRLLDFLTARLDVSPTRRDLRDQLVRLLHLRGDHEKAREQFQLEIEGLTVEQADEVRLELSRFLRSEELYEQAVPYLETVVEDMPDRLDLRQELAENLIEIDSRTKARQLIAKAQANDSSLEDFLDFEQFLIREDFLSEARQILERRIAIEPERPELMLLKTRIAGLQGDRATGEQALIASRELSESAGAYRDWVETAFQFHGEFDNQQAFFEEEQLRITGGDIPDWTAETISRFLALCETAREENQPQQVALVLRGQLDTEDLPADLRVELRSLLVRAVRGQEDWNLELENQLTALLEEDAENADTWEFQLGLLQYSKARPDLARGLLQGANAAEIEDADLLAESWNALLELDLRDQLAASTEQLILLEPDRPEHRERLMTLYAWLGDEAAFRQTLRKVQEDADLLALPESVSALLTRHEDASWWRTISESVQPDGRVDAASALSLLGGLQGADDPELWQLWAKALLHRDLGQDELRDAAIESVLEMAAANRTKMIQFPDGLKLSVGMTERLLKEPTLPAESEVGEILTLSDTASMRWAFEGEAGAALVQIEQSGDRIYLLDQRRNLWVISASSGKLLWQRDGRLESLAVRSEEGAESSGTATHRPARFALDQKGNRLLMTEGGTLRCLSAEDGTVLWESAGLMARQVASGTSAPAPAECWISGDLAILHDAQRQTVEAYELKSGKLVWSRTLQPAHADGLVGGAMHSGMDVQGDQVLIHGAQAWILDSRTGDTIWELAGRKELVFPVDLRPDLKGESGTFKSVQQIGRDDLASALGVLPEENRVLTSPAVRWAESSQPRHAAILGRKLLLMGEHGLTLHSLDFPVASRSLEVEGIYLGGHNQDAAFLSDDELTIVHLTSGAIQSLELPEGHWEGFVQGPEVHVVGRDGLQAWNLHTGRKIHTLPTPDALMEYASRFPDVDPGQTTWRGRVVFAQTPGGVGQICLPPISQSLGNRLLLLRTARNSLVALSPSDAEDALY